MPLRLLSFLLALLMVWSAFSTQEQPLVTVANTVDIPVVIPVDFGHTVLHDGSVADHHLDDQPGQAHVGVAADLDGLLPPECRMPSCTIGMPIPTRQLAQLLPAPYLDGLQRPPRVMALLG